MYRIILATDLFVFYYFCKRRFTLILKINIVKWFRKFVEVSPHLVCFYIVVNNLYLSLY